MYDLECDDFKHGKDCQMDCGNCYHAGVCHHVNGTCPDGCASGYIGETCVESKEPVFVQSKIKTSKNLYNLIIKNLCNISDMHN